MNKITGFRRISSLTFDMWSVRLDGEVPGNDVTPPARVIGRPHHQCVGGVRLQTEVL